MTDLIGCQDALDAFCEQASASSWLGLVTEFERVRTYYPQLCLLQLSTPDMTVCVDPLADIDMSPLNKLITRRTPIKILHAARQDLEVLQYALQASPTNLFDTQIAAALAGYGDQVGYANLVQSLCGVELPKQQTRSDWSRRPLSEGQLRYALDDARYLGVLFQQLSTVLEGLNRLPWVNEDCARLVERDLLAEAADTAVVRTLARARKFSEEQLCVCYALARWREQTAKDSDLPRGWVLPDSALLAIARKLPADEGELQLLVELPSRARRRWGKMIVAVVEQGRCSASPVPRSTGSSPLSRKEKRLANELWERLKHACADADIPTSTVVRRNELAAMVRGERDLALLRGWREGFIGREFLAVIDRLPMDGSC